MALLSPHWYVTDVAAELSEYVISGELLEVLESELADAAATPVAASGS